MKKAMLLLVYIFFVSNLGLLGQNDCQKFIRSTYDEYESLYRFHTPMVDERGQPNGLFFMKTVKNGISKYYLGIDVITNIPYPPRVDFIVLFIGGKKVVRRDYTVSVNVNNGVPSYRAVTAIPLTESEKLLFTKEIIKGFRVHVDDYEVEVLKALQRRKELDCLIDAPLPKK